MAERAGVTTASSKPHGDHGPWALVTLLWLHRSELRRRTEKSQASGSLQRHQLVPALLKMALRSAWSWAYTAQRINSLRKAMLN